jgi:glycopeptide antibiotics resistance protein
MRSVKRNSRLIIFPFLFFLDVLDAQRYYGPHVLIGSCYLIVFERCYLLLFASAVTAIGDIFGLDREHVLYL